MDPHVEELIGRGPELSLLTDLLRRAEGGQGGLALLTGEAGVGKTALADAASGLAEAKGFAVTWGRATRHAGAPPYWALRQALEPLLEADDGADLVSSAALLDIVPDLQALRPDLRRVQFADPAAAQFAAARALVRFVSRRARVGPILLVLDDLQDADLATLRALQVLVRDLRGTRVAIIATFREGDRTTPAMKRDTVLTMIREGRAIAVERLSREDTATLLRRHAPADDALVGRVYAATGGNALFVSELARMIATSEPAPNEELPLPLGVQELVGRRLEALDPPGVRAVGAAAVLGLDAAQEEVVAMIGQPVPPDTGLIGVASGRARFSHGLLREAVYRTLADGERCALHRLAADAIAATDRSHARLTRLAYHLSRAGPDGIEDAVRAGLAAATEAVDRGGYDDARAILGEVYQRLPASVERSLRLDVLIALARAQYLSAEPVRGSELADQAAVLCRSLGDRRRFAELALVRGAIFVLGYSDPTLIAALEDALAWLGDDSAELALRARLLARLAAARQPSADPYATAEDGLAAIELARETGDDGVLLEVLYNAMAAAFEYVVPAKRLPLNRECARLARLRRNVTIEWRATMRLMFDAFELGDLDQADSALTTLHRLAASLAQDRFRFMLAMARAMRALFLGDLEEAERARRDAESFSAEDGSDVYISIFHRLGLYRATRDTQALIALARQIGGLVRDYGQPAHARIYAIVIGASIGDLDGVRAALDGEVDRRFLQERPLAVTLGEVAGALTDEQAERAYDWFLPHAGELVCSGATGYYAEGPFDHALALLASRLGRHDDAVVHLERTLSLLRRLGARPHLVRALADGARIRRARGTDEDRRAAARLFGEAREIAQALEVQTLIDYVAARDGQPPAVGAAGPAPAELKLERVGKRWRLTLGARRLELRHSVGLEVLSELMAKPGEELHVLALMGAGEAGAVDQSLGEVLDASARAQYKRRIDELDEEIESARSAGAVARAEAFESERSWLVRELSRALGLGGRARPVGATAERARVAVNRRLRRAIDRVRDGDAELGEILDASVKTGTYCSYQPLPLDVVRM